MELNTELTIDQLVAVFNAEAQKRGSNLVRTFRNKNVAIQRIKSLIGDDAVDVDAAVANAPALPAARAANGPTPRTRKETQPHVTPGIRANSTRGKIFTHLNSAPDGKAYIEELATSIFGTSAPHTHASITHSLPNLRWRGKTNGFKIEQGKDDDGKSYLQLKASAPTTTEEPAAEPAAEEATV